VVQRSKRQILLKGMAEVAIAAASFLQKRYSGKRGLAAPLEYFQKTL
jgi:hypothetical protein